MKKKSEFEWKGITWTLLHTSEANIFSDSGFGKLWYIPGTPIQEVIHVRLHVNCVCRILFELKFTQKTESQVYATRSKSSLEYTERTGFYIAYEMEICKTIQSNKICLFPLELVGSMIKG